MEDWCDHIMQRLRNEIWKSIATYNDDGSVVHLVGLVGRHGDDGHGEVDAEHVDHAKAEEGQRGHHEATLHRALVPAAKNEKVKAILRQGYRRVHRMLNIISPFLDPSFKVCT